MKPSPETVELVEKSLNQSITPEEIARLEELLEEDPANLDYYLSLMEVESEIPFTLNTLPEQKAQPKWILPTSIAAAAAIALFAGIQLGNQPTHVESTNLASMPLDEGASITSLVGVTWSGAAPKSLNLTAESEAFSISSGLVELTFASGVRTLIEGPAELAVTGGNSANLSTGKLVADVPKGAEGFTIIYPEGKVVDLGTEFALNIGSNNLAAEVGVFRGEVEVYSKDSSTPLKVLENHAVKQTTESETPFASIPFNQDDYIRKLPSSEFSWKLPETASTESQVLEFDVSHLVWKPGNYRAIFKFMLGKDALCISNVELLCDGKVVVNDRHEGRTGLLRRTRNNMFTLPILREQHRKGKWTLRATVQPDTKDRGALGSFTPDSSGIMLFSENVASPNAYIGTWEYRHDNNVHRRVFHPDHTADYYLNGKLTEQFDGASWSVKNGILVLTTPLQSADGIELLTEKHILNDKGQLVIINQPYRNALKVEKSK